MITLDDKTRKGWNDALGNTRYSNGMIADEIMQDMTSSKYDGDPIGESSVATHRRNLHR